MSMGDDFPASLVIGKICNPSLEDNCHSYFQ